MKKRQRKKNAKKTHRTTWCMKLITLADLKKLYPREVMQSQVEKLKGVWNSVEDGSAD